MTISDADRLPALADLAGSALALWDVPEGARLQLINLSENAPILLRRLAGAGRFCGFTAKATIHAAP